MRKEPLFAQFLCLLDENDWLQSGVIVQFPTFPVKQAIRVLVIARLSIYMCSLDGMVSGDKKRDFVCSIRMNGLGETTDFTTV